MKHVDKLLRGSILNVIDLVLKMVVAIVITPLMIHALDMSGYGLWLLVMSVASYCGLLDLGITFSASRFTAIALGAGNPENQGQILHIAQQYFRRIGLLILLISPALVYLIGLLIAIPDHAQVEMALAIVLITMACRFFFRLPLVLLRGSVRYDLIALSSIIRTISQSALLVWLLNVDPGIIGIAISQAVGEFMEVGLNFYFSKGIFHGIKTPLVTAGETTPLRREMRMFAGSISVISVGEALRMQANPLIVGFIRGPQDVPIYSVGMRLITMIQDVVSAIFGGSLLSIFSHLHGAGEGEELKKTFLRYSEWAAGFAACAVLGSTWLAPAFFHRWVGPELEDASQVMRYVALPYILHFSQYPANNLLYSLNKSHYLARLSIIGGIVSAVLSLLLGARYGVNGVVAGMAIEMTASKLIVMPILVSWVIGISPIQYLACSLVWPAVKTMILPIVFVLMMNSYVISDYGRIGLIGAGFAACSIACFGLMTLSHEDRSKLFKRLFRKCDYGHC